MIISLFILCAIICHAINNDQSGSASMPSVVRLPPMDNPNLLLMEPQNLIRIMPLINSIASIEPQLSENDNSNDRRATTTSFEQHTSSVFLRYHFLAK